MNIMILSPGRRVEIIEYFKKEVQLRNGKVFTLDMNPYTSGLYFSNKFFCIKKDFNKLDEYMEHVLRICKSNNINCILTLIDPELPLLSSYKSRFEESGIRVMISDNKLVEATFDKYEFFSFFKDKLPVLMTTDNKQELLSWLSQDLIHYPIFAKPKKGSGSSGLAVLNTKEEIINFKPDKEYIYQPLAKVKEYGVDMYFNLDSGKLVQYFIKEKLSMRSGETDKSISVHNDDIKNIVMSLSETGFKGVVDMDIFLSDDNHYYVNEINPRFGGGYPHAYQCRMNYIQNLLDDLEVKSTCPLLDSYEDGIIMMKYNNYFFTKETSIPIIQELTGDF